MALLTRESTFDLLLLNERAAQHISVFNQYSYTLQADKSYEENAFSYPIFDSNYEQDGKKSYAQMIKVLENEFQGLCINL